MYEDDLYQQPPGALPRSHGVQSPGGLTCTLQNRKEVVSNQLCPQQQQL